MDGIMGFFSGVFGIVFGAVLFVVTLVALGFLSFVTRKGKDDEIVSPAFGGYFTEFLKRHKISIGVSAVTILFLQAGASLVLLGCAVFIWAQNRGKGPKVKYKVAKEMNQDAIDATMERLASLGPTHAARIPAIEKLYEERTETVHAAHFATWSHTSGNEENKSYVYFDVERNLGAMPAKEREYLRIVDLLQSATDGHPFHEKYRAWRAGLIWGDGKGTAGRTQWRNIGNSGESSGKAVEEAIKNSGLSVDKVISKLLQHLTDLRETEGLHPEMMAIVRGADERTTAGAGGGTWLKHEDVKNTVFAQSGDHPVWLGSFAGTDKMLMYSGDGSILTIAPPGAGKTQCFVFPNLLMWNGPAVVLDISGDIYEHTSKWRAENVGPVYKFSPLEPEASHHYNPLTFVRSNPYYIWEDSRLLAEMMIVPSGASDPFWENEARNVLTAAIAFVCYQNQPEKRPLHDVLDILYGGEPWDAMITGLKMAVDVRVMTQNANALAGMNEKTLSSVLQTARSSMSAWAGERIAAVTDRSDWSPNDLRKGTNPTIYIHMRPNEVESYLSLLRVFIGQHIRMLTAGEVPPRGSPPILFMLDELPRLRYMPPVDEALNIGRKYGLRLWMFAQSIGQLKNAYENADGMMSSCAVRIFMNPSGADGLADRLSEELGYVDSLADGTRKKMVEANELAGPTYREKVIVFGVGARPARLEKAPAWKNPLFKDRMGA